MDPREAVYILGCGAIGLPLAAYLTIAGRSVVAVRTSVNDVPPSKITVTARDGAHRISTPVETVSLSALTDLHGTIVVAAKSYANAAIALALKDRAVAGPLVILQNGIGVEKSFLDAGSPAIYRGVLYITSQATSEYDYAIRPVAPSPIGNVTGSAAGLQKCVQDLTTESFPFRSEANIQREVWKKAVVNAVFNSICPLLEVDNGAFVRNEQAAGLAREVVRECIAVTDRLGIALSESEVMEQIMRISKASDGQLISTLQDIKAGRRTEIESLNLEIARIASSMQPRLEVPRTEVLGKMILARSSMARRRET